MEIEEAICQAREDADTVVRMFHDVFKIELDYSLESVEKIDAVIDEMSAGGKEIPVQMRGPVMKIGCYVGQVMCAVLGGEWADTSSANGFPLGIKVKGEQCNIYLNPFEKVIKRYRFGKEHDLSAYVKGALLTRYTFE